MGGEVLRLLTKNTSSHPLGNALPSAQNDHFRYPLFHFRYPFMPLSKSLSLSATHEQRTSLGVAELPMRRRICPLYEWLPNARARRSVCGAEDGRPLVHARGGNRTRTPRKGKGILSPSRLPFRHPGQCRTRPYEQHRDTGVPPHVPVIVSVESWRAGNGTRTRDPNLGKVVLYQLSYSRSRPKTSRSSASEQEDAPGTPRLARPSLTAMPTLEYSCCTVR